MTAAHCVTGPSILPISQARNLSPDRLLGLSKFTSQYHSHKCDFSGLSGFWPDRENKSNNAKSFSIYQNNISSLHKMCAILKSINKKKVFSYLFMIIIDLECVFFQFLKFTHEP
jgi:hypothetical protein